MLNGGLALTSTELNSGKPAHIFWYLITEMLAYTTWTPGSNKKFNCKDEESILQALLYNMASNMATSESAELEESNTDLPVRLASWEQELEEDAQYFCYLDELHQKNEEKIPSELQSDSFDGKDDADGDNAEAEVKGFKWYLDAESAHLAPAPIQEMFLTILMSGYSIQMTFITWLSSAVLVKENIICPLI
ncbi:hypothetical protein CPB84DRAFT_1757269 [Gymnopilus junonius]|uniref:Uncharacterized protein n=1 Tax=Gymnopilus junonius TaxID=109634 RepID=A0A9P5N6J4_GYMJU|nr:hypothetical protein CPB84DRAFT_1757269 [Gymnopilus junonius]